MTKARDLEAIQAEIGALNGMLATLPKSRVVERVGFQARRKRLEEEAARLASAYRPSTTLRTLFAGRPVVGSVGVEAQFAGAALDSVQDLVSKTMVARSGALKSSGPVPERRSSRLHLTALPVGSFGFELTELTPPLLTSALGEAVDEVVTLLGSAAANDDDFAQATADTGPRVRDAVLKFFQLLKNNGATVRLETEERNVELGHAQIDAALRRVEAARIEEVEDRIPGVFRGAMFESHRFEHRVAEAEVVLKGIVDESLSEAEVMAWLNKPCAIHVVTTIARSGGRERRSHTLVGFEPLPNEPATS